MVFLSSVLSVIIRILGTILMLVMQWLMISGKKLLIRTLYLTFNIVIHSNIGLAYASHKKCKGQFLLMKSAEKLINIYLTKYIFTIFCYAAKLAKNANIGEWMTETQSANNCCNTYEYFHYIGNTNNPIHSSIICICNGQLLHTIYMCT